MKKITIDPRVIKHLGKDLITSSEVAVIELIKNSIDANAKNINLRIFNSLILQDTKSIIKKLVPENQFNTPILIVEDDGQGMTDKVLEEGFLNIGTNIKANDTNSLGEKGIGRLATQRLGSSILVETSSSMENHTSYVYIDWNEIIQGSTTVPSIEGEVTPPHTRLWIFNINLEDYIENAIQYEQMVLSVKTPNIQINRNLRSAINFLIFPFNNNTIGKKETQIKFIFDNIDVDISFPYDKLNLAESIHQFSFKTNNNDSYLICSLNIKPWFIERVHRAIVKAEAFKRLKKSHEFYAEMLEKNKHRINNALTITITNFELNDWFYNLLKDLYAIEGDENKKDQYEDFLREKSAKTILELAKITPLNGILYSFKQGAAIGDNIIIDSAFELKYINKRYALNELKYFLDNYNGIKLYRGAYRIGFLGNKENDWIKLQQFRTKGQQWYRFDLGNTIGFVSLTDAGQNNIKEISSRLDISENQTSDAFKLLVNLVFNHIFYDLNRKANDLIKIFLAEEGLLEENISQRVKKNNNSLKEMMARNQKIQNALKDVSLHLMESAQITENQVILPQNCYQFVTHTLDTIYHDVKDDYRVQKSTANLLTEAGAQLKAIEVEAYNNYKLMANGLITETITHELHSLSKTGIISDIDKHFQFLKNYFIQASLVKAYNEHVYPVKNSYESIAGKLEQVGDLYSFLETTFIKKGSYDEFISQKIKNVIDDIRNNLTTLKKDKIDIICNTEELSWIVPKGVLLHVFYNLINNSLYWIDIRRKWALSDSKYCIEEDDCIILDTHGIDGLVIYDTGTGVEKSMEDLLFEPLQSGKPVSEGRGMGLYIVKKLLNSFGGNIQLLEERNKFNNRFKFLIVTNTSEEI